jgi:hypothetical protein
MPTEMIIAARDRSEGLQNLVTTAVLSQSAPARNRRRQGGPDCIGRDAGCAATGTRSRLSRFHHRPALNDLSGSAVPGQPEKCAGRSGGAGPETEGLAAPAGFAASCGGRTSDEVEEAPVVKLSPVGRRPSSCTPACVEHQQRRDRSHVPRLRSSHRGNFRRRSGTSR